MPPSAKPGKISFMPTFDIIAFDADDTLWHNERMYAAAEEKFVDLIAKYYERETISERLFETEMRNMRTLGYGVKAFTFSMIETAIQLSGGQISAAEIGQILQSGKDILEAPVDLFPGVAETIPLLAKSHPLMLITKGDLLDQESKLGRSGLADCFRYVEIISDKSTASYKRIFERYTIVPARFLMVGNSVKSDILPVLELGGHAVHIPFEITWAHEVADAPEDHPAYFTLKGMEELPGLLEKLAE
jgi:putative hydrolase of the HAD superfamily